MTVTANLLTYWIFQGDPHIKESQEAVYQILVEMALHNADKSLSIDEIKMDISDLIQQPISLSEMIIRLSIEKGIREKKIELISDYSFSLTSKRKEEFIKQINRYELDRNIFREGLIMAIEDKLVMEKLSQQEKLAVINGIENWMQSIFYEHRLSIARLQNGEYLNEKLKLKILEEDTSKLDESLDKVIDLGKHLRKEQIKTAIKSYFRQLPIACKRYITALYYHVFLYQILNLDPSMQKLQRNWFKTRKLYLDTNVIVALLCPSDNSHNFVKEILEATLALEAEIYISPATLNELNGQVEEAKENYEVIKNPEFRNYFNKIDDNIIKSYYLKKQQQPRLKWLAYIVPFENLESLLFDKFSILVEKEGFNEAKISPERDFVEKVIQSFKSPLTHPSIIEHDCLDYLLIGILREKYAPDEMGSKVWLITLDRILVDCQAGLLNRFPLPHCKLIQQWGSCLLPYENVINFIFRDFITYLIKSKLGSIAHEQFINVDFLKAIKDADLDIAELIELPPEHASKTIIKLQHAKEARDLISKAKEAKYEEKKSINEQWLRELKKAIFDSEEAAREKALSQKKHNILRIKLEEKEIEMKVEIERMSKELEEERAKSLWIKLKEKILRKND